MGWSQISAFADILGATAVILSLIYLAYQIKDARRSFVAGAQQQLGGDFSSFMESIWSDEEVFALWYKSLNTPEKLSETEKTRFGMMMFSMFAHFSNVFELARIDNSFLERYAPVMDRMLSMPHIQGWWQRNAHGFSERSEFRRYIDEQVAEHTGKPKHEATKPT
ncbi:MAG: hypothetical protein CMN84_13530 [Spongiibacteraceae bacterium]|jgi:hypothetical protein|nr:hypothetical protein [Spongiibacteraceae bacterium]|tara:strand:- start:110 stop:604 length:495 start_codon:yes stop_codon:yes gene_type:complete